MGINSIGFIVYAFTIMGSFVAYGLASRTGRIEGRAVLVIGTLIGLCATMATVWMMAPAIRANQVPAPILAFNAIAMAVCTAFCVQMAYRQSQVIDAASRRVGETDVSVRVSSAWRLPEVDALIVPTSTRLKEFGGAIGPIGIAGGKELAASLTKQAPVPLDKIVVVETTSLKSRRGIFIAVHEPMKPVTLAHLERGLIAASQQARKIGAESVAVPIAELRGLSIEAIADATIHTVLRQRKAFAKIVFVVLDVRHSEIVKARLETFAARVENEKR